MDEKEFIVDLKIDKEETSRVLEEENEYLEDNLSKISKTLNFFTEKAEYYKDKRDANRGEPEYRDDFFIYDEDYRKYSSKSNELKDKIDSPYVMHLNLLCNGDKEDIFIGLDHICDEHGDFIVYSIWSPLATAFYDSDNTSAFFGGYNYELLYNRKMTIKSKKIVDIVEVYNNESGYSDNVTDYFLRNVLDSKKNEKGFSDIIKTIQKLQNRIIRSDLNDNIICQGIAGSGKTAIIVHRLSFLLYNNKTISPEKFLFIAPNENFKKELSDLNKKLKIDKITLFTLTDYYKEKINYYLSLIDGNNNLNNYFVESIIEDEDNNNYDKYFSDYLEKKSSLTIDNIYKNFEPLGRQYDFDVDYSKSFKDNSIRLGNLIRSNINEFNRLRDMLYSSFKEVEVKLGRDVYLDNFNDDSLKWFISNYETFIDTQIDNYEYIFNSKNEKDKYYSGLLEINNKLELLDKIFSKNNDSYLKDIDILNSKYTDKKDSNYIFEYNKIVEKYSIDNPKYKEKRFIYLNFKTAYNTLLELIDNKDKKIISGRCINILKESKALFKDYYEYSIKEYRKLTTINLISEDNVKNFKRTFEKALVYIALKPEKFYLNYFNNLRNPYRNITAVNDLIDYDKYSIDSENYAKWKNFLTFKSLFFESFKNSLNNKYELKSKMIIERQDAFLLLYTLNKLNFRINPTYNYLFIDETQDYNDEEIVLIHTLEDNPVLNIYGDYQQNISTHSLKRESWNTLLKKLNNNSKYYELNENYRNTSNVVEYCNNKLHTNMKKIGINGNDVREIDSISLKDLLKLYNEKNYQIITVDKSLVDRIKKIDDNININLVFEVKGLEYENVIVVDKEMDYNNKYVSYTRSKNDLIVIHDVIY